MIVFPCPHCPTTLRVDSTLAGRPVLCPNCRGQAVVPAAPAPPPLPAPPPIHGAPANAGDEVITDLVPVEEVRDLEPVREEEEVIDLPAPGAGDVLDAQPADEEEVLDAQPGDRPRREPRRKKERGTRYKRPFYEQDARAPREFGSSRNRIMGGIGTAWGLGIIIYSATTTRYGGAYGAGQVAGMMFGILMFGVGLYYLIRG